jgi:hypothetical protein
MLDGKMSWYVLFYILIVGYLSFRFIGSYEKYKSNPSKSSSHILLAIALFIANLVALYLFGHFLITRMDWLGDLAKPITMYYGLEVGLLLYFASIPKVVKTSPELLKKDRFKFLVVFFIALLYLTSLLAFSAFIYRGIPESKGGRLPLTFASILVKGDDEEDASLLLNEEGVSKWFVMDTHARVIYASPATEDVMRNWLTEYPPVTAIPLDRIARIDHTPVECDGIREYPKSVHDATMRCTHTDQSHSHDASSQN